MKKTLRRSTDQEWTTQKKAGTLALLVTAGIGTYIFPFLLLDLAGEANGHRDGAAAHFWEEWALGLVVLGPSLFTTTFLAMASQQPKSARMGVRVFTVVMFAVVYWLLLSGNPTSRTSIMLGMIGVLYTVFADAFTPDSSVKATTNDEQTEDYDSAEHVAMPQKPVVATVPASLKPESETSKASIPLTLVMLVVVPAVAIALDVRDLAVRNASGAVKKSRR